MFKKKKCKILSKLSGLQLPAVLLYLRREVARSVDTRTLFFNILKRVSSRIEEKKDKKGKVKKSVAITKYFLIFLIIYFTTQFEAFGCFYYRFNCC